MAKLETSTEVFAQTRTRSYIKINIKQASKQVSQVSESKLGEIDLLRWIE
jgi:hypothetical protein